MVRKLSVILFVFQNSFLLAQKSGAIDEPVREAIVQYGNEYLIDGEYKNLIDYQKILDSLILEDELKDSNYFILKNCLTNDNFYREYLMDSLFKLDNIPYDLINELERVNFFFSDEITFTLAKPKQDLTGESEFPSNELYHVWNTRKIWNHIEIPSDSSFIYQLKNEEQKFTNPVCKTSMNKYNGRLSSHFGWRNGKMHNGVDITMDQWDSVQCVFDGKVRFAREFEGFGKVVVVRHFNGLETIYAHLARIKVKPGQNINSGDLIGLAGSTGSSDGSHLHFEVRYLDKVLNPENIINFADYQLKSDSLYLKKIKAGFVAIPATINFHVIERGDYPLKISNRYGLDLATFCELNNITNRSKLKVGEKVLIK